MSLFPSHVYPSCGLDNPPAPSMDSGPGVFECRGTLPDGSRLLLAYDAAGVIVGRAIVEPGGDLDRATLDLDRLARAARA